MHIELTKGTFGFISPAARTIHMPTSRSSYDRALSAGRPILRSRRI